MGNRGVGAKCCSYLDKLGIKTDFFIDKDEKVVKTVRNSKHRVPLYLPHKLDNQNTANVICFVAVGDTKKILPQLEGYNFKEIVCTGDGNYTLDFYLEAVCLLVAEDRQTLTSNILETDSLLSDDKSLEILWRHLNICFGHEGEENFFKSLSFTDIADKNQYFLCDDMLPKNSGVILHGRYIKSTGRNTEM